MQDAIDNNHVFTRAEALFIFKQLVVRLHFMHEMLLVHRDVKPANLCFGLGDDRNLLYLIDFGLTVNYVKLQDVAQVQFVGTVRYAPLASHLF